MNKLKPCPFCGKDVKEWDNSNATIVNVIECTHCKVRFVFPCSIISDVTGDNYIQTFNKRRQLRGVKKMSREEHIKELILYLKGKTICMCPATKSYWEKHYHEIEQILNVNKGG